MIKDPNRVKPLNEDLQEMGLKINEAELLREGVEIGSSKNNRFEYKGHKYSLASKYPGPTIVANVRHPESKTFKELDGGYKSEKDAHAGAKAYIDSRVEKPKEESTGWKPLSEMSAAGSYRGHFYELKSIGRNTTLRYAAFVGDEKMTPWCSSAIEAGKAFREGVDDILKDRHESNDLSEGHTTNVRSILAGVKDKSKFTTAAEIAQQMGVPPADRKFIASILAGLEKRGRVEVKPVKNASGRDVKGYRWLSNEEAEKAKSAVPHKNPDLKPEPKQEPKKSPEQPKNNQPKAPDEKIMSIFHDLDRRFRADDWSEPEFDSANNTYNAGYRVYDYFTPREPSDYEYDEEFDEDDDWPNFTSHAEADKLVKSAFAAYPDAEISVSADEKCWFSVYVSFPAKNTRAGS